MADQPTVAITRSAVTLLQAMAGAAPRRPCLILYSGPESGRPFDLQPGVVVIGRSPGVEYYLDNASISRRHAELRVTETSVTLADLGSVNGTYVDEVRVTQPVVLKGGEMIRMGLLVFRYYESQSLDAALHDRIYRMATVDTVTEIFNRRYLIDALKREMQLAQRHGTPLAVICYDLDHFKQVNDRHGHAAGDIVLRTSAALLRTGLQGHGVLGRLGGEEFAIVLPNTPLHDAVAVAEGGRAAIAAHRFELREPGVPGPAGVVHHQTVSAGVALMTPAMTDPTELLAAADRLLYASKEGGRNRVSC